MVRKKSNRKLKDEWNIFGLRVLDYNVDFEWGFNPAIHDRKRRSDESPVYESHQHLYLDFVVLWPEDQKGDLYHITLTEPLKDWFFGPPTDFNVKLGEFAAKDSTVIENTGNTKESKSIFMNPHLRLAVLPKVVASIGHLSGQKRRF